MTKSNYKTEKKMLIIVKICKQWKHYLKNVIYQIRIIINYYNLPIFFKNKTLNKKNSLIKTFINIKFIDWISIQKKNSQMIFSNDQIINQKKLNNKSSFKKNWNLLKRIN